jgi:hypothetical protein
MYRSTESLKLNDNRIRESLRLKIRTDYASENDLVVIDELGVLQGDYRVDLAAVNGCIHGYEIKSDVDSLSRLGNQLQAYSCLFEYLTLVVGTRHLSAVRKMIPKFCGLVVAQDFGNGVHFKQVRSPKRNRSIKMEALVQLLWKEEALQALEMQGMAKGYRSKPRKAIWEKLVEVLPASELQHLVTSAIKARTSWRVDAQLG